MSGIDSLKVWIGRIPCDVDRRQLHDGMLAAGIRGIRDIWLTEMRRQRGQDGSAIVAFGAAYRISHITPN